MNIFLEMVHSVAKPKSYGMFLRNGKLKTFFFGFLLVLFYFIITVLVPVVRLFTASGGFISAADAMIPDFTIENCTVYVDGTMEYEKGGIYVFANTDSAFIDAMSEDELTAAMRLYDRVLLMDSRQAVIKNMTRIQRIAYEDLDPDLFMTKDKLLKTLESVVNVAIAVILAVVFVGMELLFFLGAVFVALCGMVVASCMHCGLTFGQLYKLGIHARTTPLIIKAVLAYLPFGIPMYFVISVGISVLYLVEAIRHIKTPILLKGSLVFSSAQTGPVQNNREPWEYESGGYEDGSVWNRPEDAMDRGPQDGSDKWSRP